MRGVVSVGPVDGRARPRPGAEAADVIIVGGGPAGSSLALALSRRGVQVELYEQARFPRHKPCGEGMLPGGVDVLRQLGMLKTVGGTPLSGLCYHVGSGSVRTGFEPNQDGSPRHGLGQRRYVLDHALYQAAASAEGVSARQGVSVRSVHLDGERVAGVVVDGELRRARWVVAADGTHSTVCRQLGLRRAVLPKRVGIRAHFSTADGNGALRDVHVFMREGYELYVTPLPDGELLVAALAHHDVAGSRLRTAFARWREREPQLRDWLSGSVQTSELMGRAPLMQASTRSVPPGLILLGDAARSVDPITAGGMSLALVSALLLANHLPAMMRGDEGARHEFERRRARLVRVHRMLGAGLLALSKRPCAARSARRVLHAFPAAMRHLVELAARGATC